MVSDSVKAATRAKLSSTFDMFADVSAAFVGEDPATIDKALDYGEFQRAAEAIDPVERLRGEVEAMLDETLTADTLDGLNAIMIHDDYAFQHSVDVAIVSTMIAKQIGMPPDRLAQITLGGLLHDVGKVFVPLSVLNKPGKLTDEEFEIIKTHPARGYQMLRAASIGDDLIAHHVVYQHHERQDGDGYPRGLTGQNRIRRSRAESVDPRRIHVVGEISGIADTYEALVADRPYRIAFGLEKVREIL
ncbi:MAG: HD domain-containing protein [Chloroflexota bacterium]|nr:HD domain-containing protein [Chloroflexota bacterium]MDP6508733.1 HD domain-containing protein [Chloroflexota bacterium]MDP6758663.1 HD domain-containing protein [Chloroflexota bacterium]